MKKLLSFLAKTFFIPHVRLGNLRFPTFKTPEGRLRFPRIGGYSPDVHIPSMSIRMSGLKLHGGILRVGLTGMIFGAGIIALAIFFSIKGLNAAPIWPEPALYNASLVQPDRAVQVGKDWEQFLDDQTPAEVRALQTMTLQLNLSSARAGDITLTGLDIGKASGLTDAIQIVGSTGGGHNLVCDEIILDGLEATILHLGNSEIYVLNVTNVIADGLSISPTLSSTPKDIVVQSTRGTVSVPAVTNSTYDRIIIDVQTADGFCRKLTLSNISAYGAGINLDDIHAGTLTIQNSIIGNGTGIDTASFTIANTTKINTLNATNNVERPVSVQ